MFANRQRLSAGVTTLAFLVIAGSGSFPAAAGKKPTAVTVSPAQTSLELGANFKFTAKVTGSGAKKGVEWLVEGVVGGNDTVGRIAANGRYTAPTQATLPKQIHVSARSKATPTASAMSTATLTLPNPTIDAIFPPKVATGAVSLRIEGKYYSSGLKVKAGSIEFVTTYTGTNLIAYAELGPNTPDTLQVVVYDPAAPTRKSAPQALSVFANDPRGLEIYASSLSIRAGETYTFRATYNDMLPPGTTWFVNGKLWGDDTVGKINDRGYYEAPDVQPSPSTLEIVAKSADVNPKVGKAFLSILPPMPMIHASFPNALRPGTPIFTLQGRGFVPGSQVLVNGTAVSTTFASSTTLQASLTLTRPPSRRIYVQVKNPAPGDYTSNAIEIAVMSDPNTTTYRVNSDDAARFLTQAAFGPNEATIDRVRELGYEGWIDEQFTLPEATYPPLPAMNREEFASRTFARHMLTANDQLRQRMVFFLGQHFVVSNNKLRDEQALMEYQRVLSLYSFGSFRQLLEGVTLSPTMARYLDMANSERRNTDGSVIPNENYAREVMQLFSVGLVELNLNGTPVLDGGGHPVPTYTQETVGNLARVFTGWAYPLAPGQSFVWPSEIYYRGVMQPFDAVHDTAAKTLMRGYTIPPGGTVRSDTTAALDHLFQHPTTAPFVATRMIRHFVKSNPSPEYVARVAQAFVNNGRGARGDLKAVLKAVLLDPEARTLGTGLADGKLREPILHLAAMLRTLQAQPRPYVDDEFATRRDMAQKLLESPTVFNFFSPLHKIEGTEIFSPELQAYTPVSATSRANVIFRFLNGNYLSQVPMDLNVYNTLAGNPTALVDRVNRDFFYGRMSTALRDKLISTVSRQTTDARRRAMSALWLALTSTEYAIQY